MAQIKTRVTDRSVEDFINSVENERKKQDGFTLLEIFKKITNEQPKLWGNSTSAFIGFGQYHYKSEKSRQEGDWPLTGFAPRKSALTIYLMMSGMEANKDLFGKLGKHKTSMGCLYINKLDDVDMAVLKELIKKSYLAMKKKHN
jgi:hypothetical protein